MYKKIKASFKLWIVSIGVVIITIPIMAQAVANTDEGESAARMELYEQFEYASGVPWFHIAAVDQYERNISTFKESDLTYPRISIKFSNELWSGALSPANYETSSSKIALFGGIGLDGDSDGIADIHNEDDVMYTLVKYLLLFESFETALHNLYQNDDAVRIILSIAKLFEHYERIDLDERVFPIALWQPYSYSNGYGAARGWGGRRSHEGIDIFANYGTSVVSTSYGVIEVIGWNEYGGFRIGIRDMYNTYQYYAHLQGFAKGLEVGMIVEPGQHLGTVGSTGYGPVGTSGKFDPHLHFGLYKFDGLREWAFNPYTHLIKWEK